jgi:hypothetical protein
LRRSLVMNSIRFVFHKRFPLHPAPLPCLRPARRDFAQAGERGRGE